MRNFKRKTMIAWILLSTCLILVIGGCTSGDQLSEPDETVPYGTVKAESLKNPGRDPSELPQLEGGAEIDVRPKRPSSNQELQRKYPNILVLRGPLDQKKVALTFDDGPDLTFTPQVLDVLKKHGVKATFFLMGARAAALPEMTKRIADEGHVIGNHTYWHPKLYEETLERVHWEVTSTDEAIENIVGYRPKLFRAPYGGLTEPIVEFLGEMGYTIVGWTVDSEDWKQLSAEEVKRNVLDHIHPGAIVLFHSGGHWTQNLGGMVEALDEIIPTLKQQGYEFVTVPELVGVSISR